MRDRAHVCNARGASEENTLKDLAMVIVAITVIGWNLGSWPIPVGWIALVGVAVLLGRVHWEDLFRRLHQGQWTHRTTSGQEA